MENIDLDFEQFFDLSPDLLCIAGFDGYFKKVNKAVVNLLGYSKAELYQRPINDFVYHEDRKLTSQMRNELKRSRPLYHFENRYINKSGELIWLAWTSLPVPQNNVVFAIAKDISHKKLLEIERQDLLQKFRDENERLRQFALTTSHDLRAPVNNLLSVFDMLDTSDIQDEETQEMLELLELSTNNLKVRMNGHVDVLSDTISKKTKLEKLKIDHALEDVTQSLKSLLQSSNTGIHTDFSEWNTLYFNKAYLKSIFLNLITNAVKYAHPERDPLIHIHTKITDGRKQLIVRDNGQGIDTAKAGDRLFKMHETFHNHSDSKGIGLYLVQQHITELGGKIEVESEVGKGTCFTIRFRE